MRYVLLLMIAAAILAGCSPDQNLLLNGGSDYKHQSNDVINTHGGIENLEALDTFVENVHNQKNATVRIVQYTIEGDPILTDLNYDGTSIQYKYDTTRDQYGSGSITEDTCQSITKNESNTETSFILDCGANEEILYIEHDTSMQDNFDFHLKYGAEKKNEINTKEQKLVKDLQNGEMATVNDFQFSEEERNNIYKAMVLANYLEAKDLSVSCSKKPHESYELTVWINGTERHFEWSECDKSNDGIQMTKMKNDILAIVEKNKTYKNMPPVKGQYE